MARLRAELALDALEREALGEQERRDGMPEVAEAASWQPRSLETQGYRAITAVIALHNHASVALHESLGYEHAGTMKHPRRQARRVA